MSKRMQYMIKRQFQDLNRCLVIDSPELNIPWVMRSFIDQPYSKFFFFNQSKMCINISISVKIHHIWSCWQNNIVQGPTAVHVCVSVLLVATNTKFHDTMYKL